MAHAHAELTGTLSVVMVTAGPGVTNTVTAVANASLARVPLLLLGGLPATAPGQHGAAPGHSACRYPETRDPRTARTARVADQVPRELDEAVARAMGDLGEPGPVYIEIPTDVLRVPVPSALVLDEWLQLKHRRQLPPDPLAVGEAAEAYGRRNARLSSRDAGREERGPS